MRLLFWPPSESPSETYSRNLAGTPPFLNPGLLFPRESQSHIWLSSAPAAAPALQAGSVCSFPTAPSRADLLEGPSWSPCGALTLPLVPSGLMNRANSRRELAVLCPRHTHAHTHVRACTLENIQVYNSLVFFFFL